MNEKYKHHHQVPPKYTKQQLRIIDADLKARADGHIFNGLQKKAAAAILLGAATVGVVGVKAYEHLGQTDPVQTSLANVLTQAKDGQAIDFVSGLDNNVTSHGIQYNSNSGLYFSVKSDTEASNNKSDINYYLAVSPNSPINFDGTNPTDVAGELIVEPISGPIPGSEFGHAVINESGNLVSQQDPNVDVAVAHRTQ